MEIDLLIVLTEGDLAGIMLLSKPTPSQVCAVDSQEKVWRVLPSGWVITWHLSKHGTPFTTRESFTDGRLLL